MATFKDYLELGKFKETLLLVFGGVAGGALTKEFNLPFLLLIISLFLAVMGTNAITNYIDRDIDSVMERTKKRPIPSGRIKPEKAVYFGAILIILSSILLLYFSFYYALLWIIFGIIFDPFLYNWFTKRKTPWNIIIGSFAGGAPVLVVWSGLTNSIISVTPFLLMLTIVLWTPIHIWSLAIRYVDDYRRAKVPMLPVVKGEIYTIKMIGIFTILLIISSFLIFLLINPFFSFLILIPDSILIYMVIKLFKKPDKTLAFKIFKLSSPYLAVIFILVIINAFI